MGVAPPMTTAQHIRRWISRAGRARPSPLAVYAFGKHPAFADFVDVARLPPVPTAFRHFHDRLRPAVERDGGPTEPVVIAWHERGTSAVLWVQPSHDRGDGLTGHRRCPLLLGATVGGPLLPLVQLAGPALESLAAGVMPLDAEAMLAAVNRAAAEWPDKYPAVEEADPATITLAMAKAITGRVPAIYIHGTGELVAETAAMSAVTAATLAGWVARATTIDPTRVAKEPRTQGTPAVSGSA